MILIRAYPIDVSPPVKFLPPIKPPTDDKDPFAGTKRVAGMFIW